MASALQEVIVKKSFSVRGKMRHPGEPVTLTRIEAAGKIDAGKARLAPKAPTTQVVMIAAVGSLKVGDVIDMERGKANQYLADRLADRWSPKTGRVAHRPATKPKRKAPTKHRATTKDKPPHDNKKATPPGETKTANDPPADPPATGGAVAVAGGGPVAPTPGDTPPAVEPLPLDDFKALVGSAPSDARKHAKEFNVKARGLGDLTEKYAAMLTELQG